MRTRRLRSILRLPALLALVGLPLGTGCATTGNVSERAAGTPAQNQALERALDGLELSFVDPESQVLYTASAPYALRRVEESGAIELESFDAENARHTLVTVFAAGPQIWARMQVDGREFLTRLR